MTLTVGSLFSGIGGLDLGLERAGMRVLWQVECDPYAQKVLRKHWPKAGLYEDVRAVGARNLSGVDLICGGFPCQDISNAGRRVGIAGERSGLWSEFARLIRELRPRYVLVENVAALLVRGMGAVLGDLAASGYDAEWDCIPAAAVGAPHRRDRLFLVAYANGIGIRQQPERHQLNASKRRDTEPLLDGSEKSLADADGARESQQQGGVEEIRRRPRDRSAEVADATGAGFQVLQGREAREELSGWRASSGCGWWNPEPDVGRVANGIPSRVDRLRCLGNAVVPQVAEFIGKRILEHARGAA